MILRKAQATLLRLAQGFPVVAITGPRQSGKTTLAKATFPDKPYLSLEDPGSSAESVGKLIAKGALPAFSNIE